MKTVQKDRVAALCVVLVLGGLIVTQGSQAANWEFVPDVDVAASRLDNPRLDPVNLQGTSNRMVLDGRLRAQSYGERGFAYIEPRFRADVYNDNLNSDLDSEDLFLLAAGQYSWSSALVGARFNYSQVSILRSEILEAIPDDPDIEDPEEVEAGELRGLNQDRSRLSVVPFAQFDISERSSFRFSGRFSDVSYSGPPIGNRSDFQSSEISLGLNRRVDERTRVTARVFATSYEADLFANSTDSIGVEGLFTRPLSETWTFSLSAGVQRNEYTFVDGANIVDNADTNPTYSLSFRKRAEQTTWNIDLRRRLSPNGAGFVVVRDELRLFANRQLTPRLTGSAGLIAFATGTVGDIRQGADRDDFRVETRIEWALTQRFFINGGINYTVREFTNAGTDADSNELYVGVTYRGLARRGPGSRRR